MLLVSPIPHSALEGNPLQTLLDPVFSDLTELQELWV